MFLQNRMVYHRLSYVLGDELCMLLVKGRRVALKYPFLQ